MKLAPSKIELSDVYRQPVEGLGLGTAGLLDAAMSVRFFMSGWSVDANSGPVTLSMNGIGRSVRPNPEAIDRVAPGIRNTFTSVRGENDLSVFGKGRNRILPLEN